MKIGIISDTHNNIKYLTMAAKQMIGNYNVSTLIFLGDECEDIDKIKHMFSEVIWVPGVFCQHYKDRNIPHRIIKKLGDNRVLLTHTPVSHINDFPDDIKPEEMSRNEVDIVFYGHTHVPSIEEKEGVIWVNPGHLKTEDKKGHPASFAIFDTDKNEIKIIELLTGNEIYKKKIK